MTGMCHHVWPWIPSTRKSKWYSILLCIVHFHVFPCTWTLTLLPYVTTITTVLMSIRRQIPFKLQVSVPWGYEDQNWTYWVYLFLVLNVGHSLNIPPTEVLILGSQSIYWKDRKTLVTKKRNRSLSKGSSLLSTLTWGLLILWVNFLIFFSINHLEQMALWYTLVDEQTS